MAIKFPKNPTCTLTDADNITTEQAACMMKVLIKHLPGANEGTGTKVIAIDSNGDPYVTTLS